MKTRIAAAGAVLFGSWLALLPTLAQDAPAKPQAARGDENRLEELDEVAGREDLLRLKREVAHSLLQQSARRLFELRHIGAPVGIAPTDEERKRQELDFKKLEQARDEIEASYAALTRELNQLSRRRAGLESQTATRPVEKAAGGAGKGGAVESEGLNFVKARGLYINLNHVEYVWKATGGDPVRVEVHFRGRDRPVYYTGPVAEELVAAMERESR